VVLTGQKRGNDSVSRLDELGTFQIKQSATLKAHRFGSGENEVADASLQKARAIFWFRTEPVDREKEQKLPSSRVTEPVERSSHYKCGRKGARVDRAAVDE
jgi:hypothetical protein